MDISVWPGSHLDNEFVNPSYLLCIEKNNWFNYDGSKNE